MTILMAKRMDIGKKYRPLELTSFPLKDGGEVLLDEHDRLCLTERAEDMLTLQVLSGKNRGKAIQLPESDSMLLTRA